MSTTNYAKHGSDVVWGMVETLQGLGSAIEEALDSKEYDKANALREEAKTIALVIGEAIEDGVDGGKTVFTRVVSKAVNRKHCKREAEVKVTSFVAVTPGSSITLFGFDRGEVYFRRFAIGDSAVTGAYNLTYTGTVKSITAKRVMVKKEYGDKCKSFDFETFTSWNARYDEAETAKRNHETMMYI